MGAEGERRKAVRENRKARGKRESGGESRKN